MRDEKYWQTSIFSGYISQFSVVMPCMDKVKKKDESVKLNRQKRMKKKSFIHHNREERYSHLYHW